MSIQICNRWPLSGDVMVEFQHNILYIGEGVCWPPYNTVLCNATRSHVACVYIHIRKSWKRWGSFVYTYIKPSCNVCQFMGGSKGTWKWPVQLCTYTLLLIVYTQKDELIWMCVYHVLWCLYIDIAPVRECPTQMYLCVRINKWISRSFFKSTFIESAPHIHALEVLEVGN